MTIINTIAYEICVAARKIHQKLTLKFKKYDITPEQWVILKELSREDRISQNELALRVEKDKNNIKAIVDKLEKKQYLVRQEHPTDKRAFLLVLADRAYNLIEELDSLDKEMIDEITSSIKEEELANFKNTLERIKSNL